MSDKQGEESKRAIEGPVVNQTARFHLVKYTGGPPGWYIFDTQCPAIDSHVCKIFSKPKGELVLNALNAQTKNIQLDRALRDLMYEICCHDLIKVEDLRNTDTFKIADSLLSKS